MKFMYLDTENQQLISEMELKRCFENAKKENPSEYLGYGFKDYEGNCLERNNGTLRVCRRIYNISCHGFDKNMIYCDLEDHRVYCIDNKELINYFYEKFNIIKLEVII